MDRHVSSAFRVVIVPGLHGSGKDHWQSRWQCLYPAFERAEQVRWDVPHLVNWSKGVEQTLRRSTRPTLVVAHSFGCLATLHCAQKGVSNLRGALLVAPADPDKFGVAASLVHTRLTFPSILVGSQNDPWMNVDRAANWANIWGCDFVDAGPAGHINADSGLGDWPDGLSLLRRLASLTMSSNQLR